MIVWGWSTREIGTKKIDGACKICNANQLYLVGLQRTFNLFWIPVVPLNKITYVSCLSCGYEYHITADLRKIQRNDLNFKTPWWFFSGLIIIIVIILFSIFDSSKNAKNIQTFKNNPQAGKYFTFKIPHDEDFKSTPFTLGKIEEIKDNKILVRFANYAYSRDYKAKQAAKDSKNNADKELAPEIIEFNMQDFQKIDIQEVIGN
ncbi:hypothetical protein [Rickettsia endosymbiont of Orchestes rusci]|uniref:hypothetical protein n=1 Tax=Rickettsia endosymbiont of Orchestes rusci TaxID=3066250 RepID=UPI00209F4860|nr:hypothetical protein [Rickettsia endosymbiont of Ceutorhynchus assimilis]